MRPIADPLWRDRHDRGKGNAVPEAIAQSKVPLRLMIGSGTIGTSKGTLLWKRHGAQAIAPIGAMFSRHRVDFLCASPLYGHYTDTGEIRATYP